MLATGMKATRTTRTAHLNGNLTYNKETHIGGLDRLRGLLRLPVTHHG